MSIKYCPVTSLSLLWGGGAAALGDCAVILLGGMWILGPQRCHPAAGEAVALTLKSSVVAALTA